MTTLSLSDYLQSVHAVIGQVFYEPVWVRADIQALNSKGGHYYFELAQKDDTGQIIASCRGTLWRYHAGKILQKFMHSTGQSLQTGLSILIKGTATFHAQYGFSFNITDIDPTYTLGEIAKAYHAMLARLHGEGLTDLNRSLAIAFDLRHIIVIAPKDGAGLGDFRAEADRLSQFKACEFHYHHATFQGNHAPQELRQTITTAIKQHQDEYHALPDLLVIIRGGGAVGDLAYLNDYELACLVAEQPVPVWVGIGHERDRVILDEVAHTSFDTPSKVIFGIEKELRERLYLFKTAINTIKYQSKQRLATAQAQCQREQYRTQTHANARLSNARHALSHHTHQHKTVLARLTTLREHCRHLQSVVLSSHPKRMLAQGYAIVRQNNNIVSYGTINPQQKIDIEFFDGKMSATINKTTPTQ
ncbi:exodeoxyribonuclease VII large subunit [Moraxella oblonga]|uniref:exodeoxyribonuclease VII large subunit n=1 Tax=Moraxella oblonga TaxID=200413 RepID=UPI0008319920|nr:exodeoxyribonuclease VII large subunit [Moraxella oblonga]